MKYTIEDLKERKIEHKRKVTWFEFDIDDLMPDGWKEELIAFAKAKASRKYLIPTSVTSREKTIEPIPFAVVGGDLVRKEKPWFFDYYEGLFKDCAQLCYDEKVLLASKDKYAVNFNVKGRGMRYEAHVDSNPIEVLVYITTHKKGSGGELVVAANPSAMGLDEIDSNCEIIYPEAGKLLTFDFRSYPHYVRPITEPNKFRIAAAMNYYTKGCTEAMRPADLDKHLYGIGVDFKFQ